MKYQPFKRRDALHHTDDWLMTYADMITLLLCFFAIFLSVSLHKKVPPMPVAKVVVVPAPAAPPDIPETAPPVIVRPVPEQPPIVAGNLPFHNEAADDDSDLDMQPLGRSSPEDAPPAMSLPVPNLAPASVKTETPAKPELGGDRITIVEMNSAAFFASGDAKLSEPGKRILRGVAEKLKDDKYAAYQITVEGHTDDSPIHTAKFASNWELSTMRAAAVVHYLLDRGLPAARLRAVGYADTQPKVPNRDAGGNPLPANQSQNRRVVIQLERILKNESER